MSARQNPGFVRHPRRIGTRTRRNRRGFPGSAGSAAPPAPGCRKRRSVLCSESSRAPRAVRRARAAAQRWWPSTAKSGCSNSCPALGSVILENADVLETAVALQVLDALRHQHAGTAQFRPSAAFQRWPVVRGILEQNLVRADRAHAVIQAIARAAPARLRCGRAASDGPPRVPTTGCHQSPACWRPPAEPPRTPHKTDRPDGARSGPEHHRP